MNYVPNTDADREAMLCTIGVGSASALFADIPAEVRDPALDLPEALSELELRQLMGAMAAENADSGRYPSFLGAGAYNHFIPSVVGRVTGRSEFSTAYTPYQPEISQGTLQSIFEFQSMVCRLTGMDVANASLYDGASATAEAVVLSLSATRRHKVVLGGSVHPEYRTVLRTFTRELGLEYAECDLLPREGRLDPGCVRGYVDENTACVIVQQPNFLGHLEDVTALAEAAHSVGALFVVAFDPISLGVLRPPAAYGADVAVAEGQSLGIPVGFGGPSLGIFACREKYLRQMPGRLVGETVDNRGQRGYVLTLQAREQHIRREKATSNICTNQALMALAATVYLSYMGPQGLKRVAELSLQKAHYAARRLSQVPGYSLPFSEPFFKEFVLRCPRPAEEVNALLWRNGIVGGYALGKDFPQLRDCLLLCVTEMNTVAQIDRFVAAVAQVAQEAGR
ncbi:MAG: aminomethyl-transferring glycine dehydrogenase subunit GcvPA [Chloroflexota bacterium]